MKTMSFLCHSATPSQLRVENEAPRAMKLVDKGNASKRGRLADGSHKKPMRAQVGQEQFRHVDEEIFDAELWRSSF